MDLDIGSISIGADIETTRLNVYRFAKLIRYTSIAASYRKGKFGNLPKRRRLTTVRSKKISKLRQDALLRRTIQSMDTDMVGTAYVPSARDDRPALKYITIPR